MGWLILEMTDSPFMVGVSGAARMAPFFFLGLPAGAVTDRVNRRIFARIVTLAGGTTALFTMLVLLTGVAKPWQIIVFTAAGGSSWAFHQTVILAYTYDIVGPRVALNGLSLMSLGRNLGAVVGSVVGGIVIARYGAGAGYIAVSVGILCSLLLLLPTRESGQAAPVRTEPILKNLMGTIALLRSNRILMALLALTSASEIFGFSHQSLLPVFSRDVLGVGATGLGVVTAVRRGGGVVALLFLANLGDSSRKGVLLFVGIIGYGLSLMTMGFVSNLYVALVVIALVSCSSFLADTLHKTLMQENVPNEERGRAMGFWVLGLGTGPIGHLGVGGMASALGAPLSFLINGSVLATIGLASAFGLRRVRELS